MMFFILFLVLFIVSFAVQEHLRRKGVHQRVQRFVGLWGGLSAWSLVITMIIAVVKLIGFLKETFSRPASEMQVELYGLAIMGIGVCYLIMMLFYLSQIYETWSIRNFFVLSLQFRSYDVVRKDIFVEFEKKTLRQIHRETTGQPFPDDITAVPKTDWKVERREKESAEARSLYRNEEVRRLSGGETIDITGVWKLNCMKRTSHEWYEKASNLQIDPREKTLSLQLNFHQEARPMVRGEVARFRFLSSLYVFLSALSTEPWMNTYRPFFSMIRCTCISSDEHDFANSSVYPFLRIVIKTDELRKREGKYFDARHLKSIATVTFRDGERIDV